MEARVPYLNISEKQYRLIGITWGFIFTALFHFYNTFEKVDYSIVKTFISGDFALKATLGMILGYIVSYYLFRNLNK